MPLLSKNLNVQGSLENLQKQLNPGNELFLFPCSPSCHSESHRSSGLQHGGNVRTAVLLLAPLPPGPQLVRDPFKQGEELGDEVVIYCVTWGKSLCSPFISVYPMAGRRRREANPLSCLLGPSEETPLTFIPRHKACQKDAPEAPSAPGH